MPKTKEVSSVISVLLIYLRLILYKEGFPIAATQKLVTTGPYAHSRNPLVVSTFSVYWGVGIIIGSLVFIILTSFFFLVMVVVIALFEEKSLERRFGREYLLYRQKTPFMIPRQPILAKRTDSDSLKS